MTRPVDLAIELQAPAKRKLLPAEAATALLDLVANVEVGKLVKATGDADVRAAYARMCAAAQAVRDAAEGDAPGGMANRR